MSSSVIAHEVARYARGKLEENMRQIKRCLGLLSPEQVWHRPSNTSNAVGNLVIHLRGNIHQWILAGLGGQPCYRDRPAEFAEREILPTERIARELGDAVQSALQIIDAVDAAGLAARYHIQGYESSGLAVVFHVVEHFSFHAGQIIYATKSLTAEDLSLYDPQGRRLDGRSEGVP